MFNYNIFNNPTYLVIGIFLISTLIFGLVASRNIKTFKEYVFGKGRFSTVTLTLSYLATYLGAGSIIGHCNRGYSIGIRSFLLVSFPLSTLFFGYFLGPRLIKFKNCYTIGDLMQKLYGKKGKIIAAISSSLLSISIICMQFVTLGKILQSITGINSIYFIVISGVILCIYSVLGGIKAVTITDVLQFLVLIIAIPLVASIILSKIGGYKELFLKISKKESMVLSPSKFYNMVTLILTIYCLPEWLTLPPLMQRVFMARDKQQIRQTFFITSIIDIMIRGTSILIGLGAFILLPNICSDNVLPSVIKHYITNPIIKGVVLSGIIAVIMSTLDSFIHSLGILITRDLIEPFYNLKDKTKLCITKFATVLTGAIAMLICSLIISDKMDLIEILLWGMKFSTPILMFPLIYGIIGIKVDNKSFFISVGAAFLGLFISNKYLNNDFKSFSITIAIFSNATTFIISNIIINGGIILVKKNEDELIENEKFWKPNIKSFFENFYTFIPTPKNIYNHSRRAVIKYGANNILFGIFCCVNFTVPYFLWSHNNQEHFNIIFCLRFIGGTLAGLLIVKSQWKEFFKPYFPIFWHLTLTYCLPFITVTMFFITRGTTSWIINMGISIFFLILLVDGMTFLILYPLGSLLAILFYKWQFGPLNLSSLGFDVNYHVIYQLLFSTIIGLLFAYRKRILFLLRGDQNINMGLSLCHEIRNSQMLTLPYSQIIRHKLSKIKQQSLNQDNSQGFFIGKDDMKYISETSDTIVGHGQNTTNIVKAFEKIFLECKNAVSSPTVYSIKSIIEKAITKHPLTEEQKTNITLNLKDNFYAKVPINAFTLVISNILRNAYSHGMATKINIWISDNEIHIKDNGKGIPAGKQVKIFDLLYTTGKSNNTGIGLAFAKQLITSLYGDIWCESEQGKDSYTEIIIQLPQTSASEGREDDITQLYIR